MCSEIYHELANKYFNRAQMLGIFFTYNIGRAKSYHSFDSWLYYNKNDEKIDP